MKTLKSRFTSWFLTLMLVVGLTPTPVHAGVEWTEYSAFNTLKSAIQNLTEGDTLNARLAADIECWQQFVFPYNKGSFTVNLDLNGHVITRNDSTKGMNLFQVSTGTTLNISDSNPEAQHTLYKLECGTYSTNSESGGEPVTVTGGVITGNWGDSDGGAIYNLGTVTMSGGTICGNRAEKSGGGVSNYYRGSRFTMTGGKICDNTLSSGTEVKGGGGVYNCNLGTITMTGGEISNNHVPAGIKGGGVYQNSGAEDALNLSGTVNISGNTAGAAGSDVHLGYDGDAKINIAGALTLAAPIAIQGDSPASPFTIGYHDNVGADPENFFVSGDSAYKIVTTSNGELGLVVNHTHSFSNYTLTDGGNAITASCTAAGCPLEGTDHSATLTISAPLHTHYGDGKDANAVITDPAGMQGTAEVQYQTKTGTDTYGEATTTAPTAVGSYKASITVGGKTAAVEYTIQKAVATKTDPEGSDGLTAYNGSAQQLINAGSSSQGTFHYRLGTTGDWTTDATGITATNAGSYTVYWYFEGDEDHGDDGSAAEPNSITGITIDPKAVSGLTVTLSPSSFSYNSEVQVPSVTVKDGEDTLTKDTDYTVSYKLGGEYVTSPMAAGVYTLEVYGKGNYDSTAHKDSTFTISGASISGSMKYGQELTAELIPAGADPTYQWYRGASPITGAISSSYTLTADDIGKSITVAITDGGNTYTSAAGQAVEKADGPSAPVSSPGITTEGVVEVPNPAFEYGYRLYPSTDDYTWTTSEELPLLAGKTYEVVCRYAATATAKASEPSSATIVTAQLGAIIGDKSYASISAAIEDAEAGATIVLTKDCKSISFDSDKALTIDLNGKKVEKSITVTHGTLTIIDSMGCATVHEDVIADGGNLIIEGGNYLEVPTAVNGGSIVLRGGGFIADPLKNPLNSSQPNAGVSLASDKQIYTGDEKLRYRVGDKKTDVDNDIIVSTGASTGEIDDSISPAVASSAGLDTIAAKSSASDGLQEVVVENMDRILDGQAKAQITDPGKNIVVIPSLKVDVKAYDSGATTKRLLLHIQVVYSAYETAATTAAGVNSVTDKKVAEGTLDTSGKNVEIEIKLPGGFASSLSDYVYVQHKGHEYRSHLTDRLGSMYAVFNNPDGFSEFLLTKTSEATVAMNVAGENRYYTDFQSALDDAKDGATIVLEKDQNINGTLNEAKTVIIDKNSKVADVVIAAGTGFRLVTNDIDADRTSYQAVKQSSGGHSSGSSGSTATAQEDTYKNTVETAKNGEVKVSSTNPKAGDKVVITPKAAAGYEVDTVTVTDANGKSITVKDNGNGTYTFTQPSGKANIKVTFKEAAPQTEQGRILAKYKDLKDGQWYSEGVAYVIEKGYMGGYDSDTFAPFDNTSRAMIAQVFYNMEKGSLSEALKDLYSDVKTNQWFAGAVGWATGYGVMDGYGNGLFGPNDPVTREQLVTILYRYAKKKGMDVSKKAELGSYADAGKVGSWALDAMQWAVGSGLISGKTATTLNPADKATRAEIATMIMRFCEKVAK